MLLRRLNDATEEQGMNCKEATATLSKQVRCTARGPVTRRGIRPEKELQTASRPLTTPENQLQLGTKTKMVIVLNDVSRHCDGGSFLLKCALLRLPRSVGGWLSTPVSLITPKMKRRAKQDACLAGSASR